MDDILELIDGALGDGLSPDAVRWSPDPGGGGGGGGGGEVYTLTLGLDEILTFYEGDAPVMAATSRNLEWDADTDAYMATLLSYGTFTLDRQAHGRFTDAELVGRQIDVTDC